MGYWEKVLERLSIPGLVLLALGLLLALKAETWSRLLFGNKKEQAVLPVKLVGVFLAALAAAIFLDFIPGL